MTNELKTLVKEVVRLEDEYYKIGRELGRTRSKLSSKTSNDMDTVKQVLAYKRQLKSKWYESNKISYLLYIHMWSIHNKWSYPPLVKESNE